MDGAGIEWARRRVGASRIKSLNELFSFSSLAQTCGELRMDEAFFLFWPIAAKDDAKKEGKFNFRPAKSIFVVCRSHDDAGPDDSIQSATAIKRKWRDFFFRYSARGGPFFLLRPIDTRSHVPIECTLDAFSCWPSLRTSQQSFSWRDVICSQLPNQTKEIPSLSLSLSLSLYAPLYVGRQK